MNAVNFSAYPIIERWEGLRTDQLEWFRRNGVTMDALVNPVGVRLVTGRVQGGYFDEDPDGSEWIVFPEPDDPVFWQPRTGEMTTWSRRTFALGQDIIDNPGTYSFDCRLNIFRDPLEWLQAKRDGIVILEWSAAYERLRDCPRIGVVEPLIETLRNAMVPPALPEVFVIPHANGRGRP